MRGLKTILIGILVALLGLGLEIASTPGSAQGLGLIVIVIGLVIGHVGSTLK